LTAQRRATVQGRVQATRIQPAGQGTMLSCRIADATGDLTAVFYGRTAIAGAEPGTQIRLHGMVGIGPDGQASMVNPGYELVR
jgi:RecG-like helicase